MAFVLALKRPLIKGPVPPPTKEALAASAVARHVARVAIGVEFPLGPITLPLISDTMRNVAAGRFPPVSDPIA